MASCEDGHAGPFKRDTMILLSIPAKLRTTIRCEACGSIVEESIEVIPSDYDVPHWFTPGPKE